MSEENNSSSNNEIANVASSLVSPNTEKAIEDIIINSSNKSKSDSGDDNEQNQLKTTNQNESTLSSSSASLSSSVSSTTSTASNGGLVPAPPAQVSVSNQSQEDNFENLQKAVQILGKAKQLDELKRYDDALKLYRQGVDMLLEELIIRQGTDQSRTYLRDKCNDFMNRIDQLKLIIQIENATAANKENQQAETKS